MSVAGAILAQTSPTVLSYGGANFYSFAFNYAVSAGDVLFFGLRQDAGGDYVQTPVVGSTSYVPGSWFFYSNPQFLDRSVDTAFRTFVDTAAPVPEPATMTLLGLAGMGARRWRQRKTS